jgi:hypothetical protein
MVAETRIGNVNQYREYVNFPFSQKKTPPSYVTADVQQKNVRKRLEVL